ncbi:MAG: TIGR03086 family protein, partial [Streptosporangiaceae bacterium]
IQEILTHGWDLAQATGQPTEGDPDLAFFALAGAKRVLPAELRGDDEIPFGPVVDVPAEAGPYAQLAAWLGRQP